MAITMAITKCSTSVLQAAILAAALLPQGTSAQGPQREYLAAASDGSELQGEVLEPGGEVWFAFRAEAGVGYGIETAGGTLRDTVLELVAADGQTTLAENDDDTRATGRQSSFLEWECPVSAIYFVKVKGYGRFSGTFMLAITIIESSGPPATNPSGGGEPEYVTAIPDGSELQGEVLEPGGEVWFAFRAEAGVGYGIETAGGTLRDTVLELVAADGQTTLAENDDDTRATGRQSSFLEWECPVSAIYFVMGKGYGSLVGTFMLAITDSSTSPSSGGGTTGSTDSPCTIDQLGQACTGFSSPDQPSICGTACEQLGREALRSGMGCNLEPRILAVLTRLVQTCGGGH